ncbi:MAG: type II toxin-antitoxin system RelE/ParE family toxin [Candidatus Dadabacteria bacterium]|nr:MAG: type II toxin-antitoxin system RelE/ParE family toxin [Candidatus Dadabacteria bacterium]
MDIRWTEQAFERLAEVQEFIARDSPVAAARMVDKIIDRAENLKTFPERGRIVPEIDNPDIREVFEGNYRIVYRVREQYLEILTVFERHRLFPEDDLASSASP